MSGYSHSDYLSKKMKLNFSGNQKPKYKFSIFGCPASSGGTKLADIGIVTTRGGFDLYVGGKGDPCLKQEKMRQRDSVRMKLLMLLANLFIFMRIKLPQKFECLNFSTIRNFRFS